MYFKEWEEQGLKKGTEMYFVYVSTSHKECKHDALHKCTNKLK